MTNTEIQIVDLLKQGLSYSQIQERLQVSSKTVAAAKKAHLPASESSIDVLSRHTFPLQPNPPPMDNTSKTLDSIIKKEQNNYLTNPKKHKTMNNEDEYYENEDDAPVSKLELEKYRLKLNHDLELQKLQASREDKEREYELREQEMQLKRDEIDFANRKAEDEKRSLLFRIKKVVDSCEDGEYSIEDIEITMDGARKALSESEHYCHINEITFRDSVIHSILLKIISTLQDFLDNYDEDNDTEELEFDNAFRRLIKRANFNTF